jgi:uncharacterized protein (TIGR02452 family)
MKRSTRQELAKQTVEIVERGTYVTPAGSEIDIRPSIAKCLDSTRLFSPEDLQRLRQEVLAQPASGTPTACEVVNETTLAGLSRLVAVSPSRVAVLNFASAKNPGAAF